MSWFTDIANKAEDFLNKVDQVAAVAIKKDDDTRVPASFQVDSRSDVTLNSTKNNQSTSSMTVSSSSRKPHARNTPVPNVKVKETKVDEDKLLEFLNNPEETVKSPSTKADSNTSENVYTNTADYNHAVPKENIKFSENNIEGNPGSDNSIFISSTNISTLELENKLLRSELSSLNQEMSQAVQRAKEAEAETVRLRKHLELNNSNVSQTERIIKDLQSKESDLVEALAAKDSQLAVLKVRLHEADGDLRMVKEKLQTLGNDRERIIQDQSDSSGLHSQALQSLRDKVSETESSLEKEKSQCKMIQNDFTQRLSKLEEDSKALSNSLVEAEKQLSLEKSRNHELASQVRSAKNSLEASRKELTDYKHKAQKILQSKEKLISSLKDAGSSDGSTNFDTTNLAAGVEIEELRQERDMLREEVLQSNSSLEQLRNELQDMESQMQSELDLSHEHRRNLEDQLHIEQKQREEIQQESFGLKEEIQYMKEEISRQKNMYQTRIHDRENELEKLRKQLTVKMMNSSQLEMENRLHTLTESLIQKQTMLEALSTEKNSLVLQMERIEQQLKENQTFMRRGNATAVSLQDESNGKGRLPSFLLESPFDGRVARKVKRAYNTIDMLSFRLGVFMRRYPMARIMVIVYMFFLHLWVFTVLLTYSPETHLDASSPPTGK